MKKGNTKKEIKEKKVSVVKKDNKDHRKNVSKIVIYSIFFVIFFIACLYCASKVTEKNTLKPISYNQKGSVEYKVYLNKNEFYTEKYLDMNKSYVASLINYIDVNFDYLFNIDTKTNMDFDYSIIGELVIENSHGTSHYLEKEYTLLESKKKKIVDDVKTNIQENIKVDYGYYNQLANSFKSTYGVDTNSYLNLYLKINAKTDKDINYNIDEVNKVLLRIPLSEKAIEINLDASNQNIIKQITPISTKSFSKKYVILVIVLFIPTCIFLLKLIKYITLMMKVVTPYDKYVNRILRNYDRLIVEAENDINKKEYHVIEVKSFVELLDAHDNLKLPILYFNKVEHEEGNFYIINSKDIYVLTIKNSDLEKM